MGCEEFKHKLIGIEDPDGAENVLYRIRELQQTQDQQDRHNFKDNKGNFKTIKHLEVEGPVGVKAAARRERVYDDNANRSILLVHRRQSKQDKRSSNTNNEHQHRIDKCMPKLTIREQLKNVQRLLQPIKK
ncbi:MAG: hypothetical protein IPP49_20735 [Saprospiraceae bacterium]|nr:hypothetical protein [Saprospiraceae bacterium]